MGGSNIAAISLLMKGRVKWRLNLMALRCSATLLTRACRKPEPNDKIEVCEPTHKT